MIGRRCFLLAVILAWGNVAKGAGPDVDALIAPLHSPDAAQRAKGARAISEWFNPPVEVSSGFSDVPVQTVKPKTGPLAPAQVDQAVDALVLLFSDTDPTVRQEAATALAQAPLKTAKVEAALIEGIKAKDAEVQRAILPAIDRLKPDVQKLIAVIKARMPTDQEQTLRYAAALKGYGDRGKFIVPALLKLLDDEKEDVHFSAAWLLKRIGITHAEAVELAGGEIKFHPSLKSSLFVALLAYPAEASRFLRAHPEIATDLGYFDFEELYAQLCDRSQDWSELRATLMTIKNLPPQMMGILRDKRFLPEIEEQIKSADGYQKTHLEAVARACGKAPDRVIKLSRETRENFRPQSAWPRTDARREAKEFGGHGDGWTRILITGRLLMPDGSPAKSPLFYATNDRMLLGQKQKTLEPFLYNQKTGEFVFVTRVFAAFASGKGQAEPGPYQTGSAQTLIEAEGAEPLVIQFFDEMPQVEVTLSAKH